MQQHLGEGPGGGLMAAKRSRAGRLATVRNVSSAVTVLAVAALGILAASDVNTVTTHTVTRHTTVVKVAAPSSPEKRTAPLTQAAAATIPSVPAAPVTAAAPIVESDLNTVVPASPVVPAASPTVAVTTTTTTTTTPPPSVPADLPACPVSLPSPAPTQQGGLASLVGLSPLFGPFSSEAFAAAPLFQPLLQAFGPFLVAFADGYAAAEPSLAPLIAQVQSSESSGFNLISPIYGPYRSQFLTAESNLANALSPLVQAAAANAATSCVVDIEAVLTAAAPAS